MNPQSLAIAYAVKRRNAKKMASGGFIKPENEMSEHDLEKEDGSDSMKMCAHGGPIHCSAGCYDEGGSVPQKHMFNPKLHMSKMAEGGLIEDAERSGERDDMEEKEEDLDPRGWNLDSVEAREDFDSENDPLDERVMNEDDNPMGSSEDESDEMGMPRKSKLLSRVLGSIRQSHMDGSRFKKF